MNLRSISKTIRLSSYTATLLYLFSGCQENEFIQEDSLNNNKYINFIFSPPSQSRAIIAEDGSGDFSKGDNIDLLYGSSKHFKLTYDNNRWTPIAITEIGQVSGDYIAFYPSLNNEYFGSRNHSIIQDQSNIEDYTSSDLLYAYTKMGNSDGNTVKMNFKHSMHRVFININAKEESILQDISVTVKGDLSSGIVDPAFGSIKYYKNPQIEEITPYSPVPGKYMAILAVSSGNRLNDMRKEWITIKLGDKTFYYSMPVKYSSLESGKETIVNLSIIDSGVVDEEFAGKTLWAGNLADKNINYKSSDVTVCSDNEINSDVYPAGIWVTNSKEEDMWSLYRYRWKEGLGWFNCRKEQTDDTKMCWAAATSDLLHWWIENNSENIKRYYEINPDAQKCPSAEFIPGKVSEIWQMYKDAFTDYSGNIPDGLEWFFSGNRGANVPDYDSKWINYKGVFKDVFGGVPPSVSDYRTVDKIRFNEVIKKALKNGEAIGFVVNVSTPPEGEGDVSSKRTLHSMTIWGAEFDDKGNVSAIYQTDNETVTQNIETSFKRAYISRRIIKYSDNGEYVYSKENNITRYREQINAVNTLGLGTKEWENYFNKNK